MKSNLIDVVSARFPELADKDTGEILDFLFDEARGSKKGLSVDIVLSTSAKMINKRIYRPSGHIGGIDSWTKPYKKPILINHNENSEPIGRIRSVEWKANPAAKKFFTTDKEYKEFVHVVNNGTPKEVQQIMNRYRLLNDRSWPGLGDLVATLDIKDRNAAEKILDERYLTFSQSSDTDSYACGECGADRMQGQKCQHKHGMKDKKGNIPVMICGNLYGKEVSTVNTPGNDTSVVFNISFEDSENGEVEEVNFFDLEDISYEATYNELPGDEIMDISEEALNSIVEKVAARMAKPVETAQEAAKPSFSKLDTAYQKRFKTTKDATSTGFALVADSEELMVYCVEDLEGVKEMLDLFDCKVEREALSDSLAKAEEYFTKVVSDEALKAEIQSLKDQLEAIKQDYARLLSDSKKEVEDTKEEKNSVSDAEGLDAKDTSTENAKEQETVENPSESGTPSLNTSDAGKTTLKDSRFEYYVGKYQNILKTKGGRAAGSYLLSIKAAGYVPTNFDPSLYI